jgi:hypothetical protein
MFAHHLVKMYEGNLHRSGNAPAESNHASIITDNENIPYRPFGHHIEGFFQNLYGNQRPHFDSIWYTPHMVEIH